MKKKMADLVTQLPDSTISGEIELELGEETDLISIYFFDDDGVRLSQTNQNIH